MADVPEVMGDFAHVPPSQRNAYGPMAESLRQGNVDNDAGAAALGMLQADPGQERFIRQLKGQKRPPAPSDGGA